VTIPGRKKVYRLYGKKGHPFVDYMALADEPEPKVGDKITCRHPFETQNRLICKPSKVVTLHSVVFENGSITVPTNSLVETREYIQTQLENFPPSVITKHDNPTKYPMMLSLELYKFLHQIWEREAPIEVRD